MLKCKHTPPDHQHGDGKWVVCLQRVPNNSPTTRLITALGDYVEPSEDEAWAYVPESSVLALRLAASHNGAAKGGPRLPIHFGSMLLQSDGSILALNEHLGRVEAALLTAGSRLSSIEDLMSAQSSLGIQEEEHISPTALDMDAFTIMTTDELAVLQPCSGLLRLTGSDLRTLTSAPKTPSSRPRGCN